MEDKAVPPETAAAISERSNEPVAPYTNAIPNNKKPVAKAPIIKYLNAASLEETSVLLLPANMYIGMDKISIPKNNIDIFV